MENPKLKIRDQEVGLRDLGGGVFEPKNISVLESVFNTGCFRSGKKNYFTQKPLVGEEPKKWHTIQSFCFVVTSNIKREAAMMLKSLRKFHSQPVYCICDEDSKRFLLAEKLAESVRFSITTEEELKLLENNLFSDKSCVANNIHKPAEILKKMDVMNIALANHDNTLFLDADIIMLDSLQEFFESPIVLSPHYYPEEDELKGFEFGFYNAGYVFCAVKSFPNFWKYLYLNNSLFFEQECMNRIPETHLIQTFSKEHNVGFWRGKEIPNKVKSFHFHLSSGVDENRSEVLKSLNNDIKRVAEQKMESDHPDLNSYYRKMTSPKKVAFIHFGKCGGVYTNEYMKNLFKTYDMFMSWHSNLNSRGIEGRDWTEEELLEIAETDSEYAYTTNHHINWTTKAVRKFKENGWFMFTFLRRPEELLCSLFHWAKDRSVKLLPYAEGPNSLQECFELAVCDKKPKFRKLWAIPEYVDLIDHCSEFNNDNFDKFLNKYFGVSDYNRSRKNVSSNKGFDYYRKNKLLTEDVVNRLFEHENYKEYQKYLTIRK